MFDNDILSDLARFADRLVRDSGITCPPLDPVIVAQHCGLSVHIDDGAASQDARLDGQHGVAFIPSQPRVERFHFRVAHEIAESRWFDIQCAIGWPVDERTREDVCDAVAGMLLCPPSWFARDYRETRGSLPKLKRLYPWASHEVIARRMVRDDPLTVVSIWDNDERPRVVPRRRPVHPLEREAQRKCRAGGKAVSLCDRGVTATAWPVNDDARGWKREIVRAVIEACDDAD